MSEYTLIYVLVHIYYMYIENYDDAFESIASSRFQKS